jgi:hypothetical protein
MVAAHSGKLETVKILVEEAGMNVNSRHEATGATPLFYSVLGGNPEVVDYLAKRGARPDVETVFGTPLRGAVDALDKNVVAALLRNRANPFADGNSAILKAEDKFREPFSSSTAHEILAMVQEAARQYTNQTASGLAPVPAKHGDAVQVFTLLNDFRSDDEKARNKHRGKSLMISGKVRGKSDDLSENVYVVLEGPTDALEDGVMCVFRESQRQRIYNIAEGTEVRIVGSIISGAKTGGIVVRNCTFE